MKYQLFLDDRRTPEMLYCWDKDDLYKNDKDWVIVKSYSRAVGAVIERGCPSMISFDHDLGGEKTGLDFAKWLVKQAMNDYIDIPNDFMWAVHSANYVGASNIRSYLNSYFKL